MSHTERAKYLTDLTDEQWQILRKLLPQPSRRGLPRRSAVAPSSTRSSTLSAAAAPGGFCLTNSPTGRQFMGSSSVRRNDGTWQRIHDTLRDMLRCRLGRKKSPERGDYRQSNGQDDRGRRRAGLRCGKEDQRTQAPYRCRYAGSDPGARRPSCRCPGPRWSGAGLGDSRPAQRTVPSAEGDLRRQRIWPKQPARVCQRRLRMVAANRAETGKGQRVRGAAQALDCRADVRLAWAIPEAQQGLRA